MNEDEVARLAAIIPHPDDISQNGASWAAVEMMAAGVHLSAVPEGAAPMEGDRDFDATAVDYRRGSPQYPVPSPEPLDVDALIAELSESPLPGARYAVTVVRNWHRRALAAPQSVQEDK